MKNFEVRVSFTSETLMTLTKRYVVRSKQARHAITNVLTNLHKGDVEKVEVEEVEVYYKPAD